MRSFYTKRSFWVVVGLLAAGAATASPWDIDMTDSRAFKAYSWKMMPPKPEGTLFRPSGAIQRAKPTGYYQNDYVAPGDRMSPSTDAMTSPYGSSEAQLKTGQRLFEVTCQPCHGINGDGHGPVTKYDPANGFNRFQIPAPALSGDGAVSAHRSDGWIYYTIRNGGTGMPLYGVSLTDAERWAIVSYVRTLPGATWADAPKAAPSAPPAATDGAAPATPTAGATTNTPPTPASPAQALPSAHPATGKPQ